jgi:nucleotide-binding universal stress UspA family protein
MMFERIVVGVDGSDHSLRAVESAAALAEKFGGALMLVCVYRHHSPLEASVSMVRVARGTKAGSVDDAMKAYAADVVTVAKDRARKAADVPVEGFVLRGPTAREIVGFAQKRRADAIVLGARGSGDVAGFMLGSVSHKIGGMSPVTCVIVK